MLNNRVTLEQALGLPVQKVESLPIQQIALLLEDLATWKARVKNAEALIESVLQSRYSDQAAAARRAQGKDTGTVRLNDDDAVVIYDLPKRVTWDQPRLRAAMRTLADEWGENPAEYVSVEIKVSETKYNAWPSKIRDLFEAARTVATGKPTIRVELREAA